VIEALESLTVEQHMSWKKAIEPLEVGPGTPQGDLGAVVVYMLNLENVSDARDGDLVADARHDRRLGRRGFLGRLGHDSVSLAEKEAEYEPG